MVATGCMATTNRSAGRAEMVATGCMATTNRSAGRAEMVATGCTARQGYGVGATRPRTAAAMCPTSLAAPPPTRLEDMVFSVVVRIR